MERVEVDAIGLFYDADRNLFIDVDGFIVYNIFEIITPNDFMLFMLGKADLIVWHRTLPGVACELYYPEDYLKDDSPPWDE
jgi:hypothetical protein